jgi:EF hand
MTLTKPSILTLAFLLTQALSPAFAASPRGADNDGAVDLNEARAAAGPEFDKLDVDNDGRLDHKELGSRLSEKEGMTVGSHRDGTLTKDEYLNAVETVFKRPTRTATVPWTAKPSVRSAVALRQPCAVCAELKTMM